MSYGDQRAISWPQREVDDAYKLVTSLLPSEQQRRRNGKIRRSRARRTTRRQYVYARTQELFKKNPGLLAKNVRNKVDWLNQGCGSQMLNVADVRELYNELWGTKPVIELPEMGDGEVEMVLVDRVLSPITSTIV